ncbi:hypothetical protein I4F81_010797 [Pyropia yezoensis]|uniref:Uncharacterized protein n=1 Tax=Pyropia yezoensis TaxID=2788 RepID=A0ACC3CER5_PYRYE|nr:hypothetical protein I4F81_010797 [Neopyropia yezoensis]
MATARVEGVDEADTLKGNGTVQYLLTGGAVHVLAVIRGGASAVRVARLDVGPAASMLADGPRLLVVGKAVYADTGEPTTRLTRVDASRPGAPVVTSTLTVDGSVGAARSIGGTATLTVSSDLGARVRALSSTLGSSSRLQVLLRRIVGGRAVRARPSSAALVAALNATTDSFWVPHYTLRRRQSGGADTVVARGPLAACARTYRPAGFAGFSLLTLLRVAIGEATAAAAADGGRPAPGGVAIASGDGTVYASAAALYVTTAAFGPTTTATAVHKFDTAAASATYVASGVVRGRLLNQFALHERAGTLFVATTLPSEWAAGRWTNSSNALTAMRVAAPCPACRRRLGVVGHLGSLGLGERIYAVRYVGSMAYVVTFREVDPLYAISLANPTRMVTLGALKVPGFSSYLHPLSPTLLLGLGRNVTPDGPTTAKASLFRVPSGGGPAGAAGCPPRPRLAELATWSGPPVRSTFAATADHRARRGPPIDRAVVVRGRYLWTTSSLGVAVHDLDTFTRTGGTKLFY